VAIAFEWPTCGNNGASRSTSDWVNLIALHRSPPDDGESVVVLPGSPEGKGFKAGRKALRHHGTCGRHAPHPLAGRPLLSLRIHH
jgi:hypothetical protein